MAKDELTSVDEAQLLGPIGDAVTAAVKELVTVAKLEAGDVFVIGCSTSEVRGSRIGTDSATEVGETIIEAATAVLELLNIALAVQCCEHLNRALVVEKSVAVKHNWPICNAVPQLHAGGAASMAAYKHFSEPVVVEAIEADAGIDIGDTFIGMHLKRVAVPVRLAVKAIGEAHVTAARVRPKYIGGGRAVYDESLM
ncbi:MAG: TIGR01440 family protein [Veillonella sp.]|uniref:TIGR01440 family protein n=1 Tax=Veillonella sp. TaxID=1926307 RepID=UPI0025D2DFF0|nr:TIGR01440 family protein [Veillonella sp.]MBE6080127.1 TIGR01440 family protein [Veillonella sp.]